MKRLLSSSSSDLLRMTGRELKLAIGASEGRTVLAEVIGAVAPVYPEVTNGELAAAFGADLLLLNGYDVHRPVIEGLPEGTPVSVRSLEDLTGRPVGVNVEPVDPDAEYTEHIGSLPEGRTAVKATFKRLREEGVRIICLTGNPQTGVSNTAIAKAIALAREVMGDDVLIIAGKMHGAGVREAIVTDESVADFSKAGADLLLLPSPGTVPGVTVERAAKWVQTAKRQGVLTMLTIGTSQEGAHEETIRQIALWNKMAGADVHHIGDAGLMGIARPENIMAYGVAIRGQRHTMIRMARSIRR